jgi:hypothetical protein
MPFLVPKIVEAGKRQKNKKPEDLADFFTERELDTLLDPAQVGQEVAEMLHKGLAPSLRVQAGMVVADVVEVVRWLDSKRTELEQKSRGTPDPTAQDGWISDLLEDMIAFDVSPANTPQETLTIITGLASELKALSDSGYGPDARNYLAQMARELDLLIEKMDE